METAHAAELKQVIRVAFMVCFGLFCGDVLFLCEDVGRVCTHTCDRVDAEIISRKRATNYRALLLK